MLQKCLPQIMKNYKDIIYYDGPILSIVQNGDEYFIYYLADLKYDLDENPYRYSYLLFKIQEGGREVADRFAEYYHTNFRNNLPFELILEDLLLDKRLQVSYGVNAYDEIVEWFDLKEYGVDKFLETYAKDLWNGLATIRKGEF